MYIYEWVAAVAFDRYPSKIRVKNNAPIAFISYINFKSLPFLLVFQNDEQCMQLNLPFCVPPQGSADGKAAGGIGTKGGNFNVTHVQSSDSPSRASSHIYGTVSIWIPVTLWAYEKISMVILQTWSKDFIIENVHFLWVGFGEKENGYAMNQRKWKYNRKNI